MGIESTSPKIAALRLDVEKTFGKIPKVHNDFIELRNAILKSLNHHISESTIERVWSYSTRGYSSISLYTLNILSQYAGYKSWQNFCDQLSDCGIIDSDMFEEYSILSSELSPGDKLQIGWLPDRICVVQFLGNNRFVALECENSTMKSGDSFSCLEFMLHQPLNMDNFLKKGETEVRNLRYVAGKDHGLTTLKKL